MFTDFLDMTSPKALPLVLDPCHVTPALRLMTLMYNKYMFIRRPYPETGKAVPYALQSDYALCTAFGALRRAGRVTNSICRHKAVIKYALQPACQ